MMTVLIMYSTIRAESGDYGVSSLWFKTFRQIIYRYKRNTNVRNKESYKLIKVNKSNTKAKKIIFRVKSLSFKFNFEFSMFTTGHTERNFLDFWQETLHDVFYFRYFRSSFEKICDFVINYIKLQHSWEVEAAFQAKKKQRASRASWIPLPY